MKWLVLKLWGYQVCWQVLGVRSVKQRPRECTWAEELTTYWKKSSTSWISHFHLKEDGREESVSWSSCKKEGGKRVSEEGNLLQRSQQTPRLLHCSVPWKFSQPGKIPQMRSDWRASGNPRKHPGRSCVPSRDPYVRRSSWDTRELGCLKFRAGTLWYAKQVRCCLYGWPIYS